MPMGAYVSHVSVPSLTTTYVWWSDPLPPRRPTLVCCLSRPRRVPYSSCAYTPCDDVSLVALSATCSLFSIPAHLFRTSVISISAVSSLTLMIGRSPSSSIQSVASIRGLGSYSVPGSSSNRGTMYTIPYGWAYGIFTENYS